MLIPCAQFAAFVLLALGLWALHELTALAPYRRVLLQDYLAPILLFVLVLYANLVALFYGIARAVGLGHTGRRLQHLERQLRTPADNLNPEVTEYLHDESRPLGRRSI